MSHAVALTYFALLIVFESGHGLGKPSVDAEVHVSINAPHIECLHLGNDFGLLLWCFTTL